MQSSFIFNSITLRYRVDSHFKLSVSRRTSVLDSLSPLLIFRKPPVHCGLDPFRPSPQEAMNTRRHHEQDDQRTHALREVEVERVRVGRQTEPGPLC